MDDDFLAPRRCLLEPIPEIFAASELLNNAADAHVLGNAKEAEDLIAQADMEAISIWTDTLWGSVKPGIHRFREVIDAPPLLKGNEKIKARMPSTYEKREIITRDGRNCRFCGIPVVAPEVRKAIQSAYPDALRWGSKNVDQHAAFQCMWLQYDHVLPHSRGGNNSLENIVITCAPCNFGRMDFTLEELGLIDPRLSPIQKTSWDGLERCLASNFSQI